MIIVLVAVLSLSVTLYALSRGKYEEYLEPLSYKDYPLKQLLPIGFYVMDKVKYGYSTRYDRVLLGKISELYGSKYSFYYLKVYWANRIATMLGGVMLLAFMGIGIGPDAGYGIFALVFTGILAVAYDIEIDKKVRQRQLRLRIDFPEFINKLTLLINAGMTVGHAWEKIVAENKKQRPLYDELSIASAEIKGGKPEIYAYEDFAKRCRIPEITKFTSVILQNIRKGNSELVSILRLQSAECWEMRKNAAKKLGEEASTKMLFPMMIMFFAILIIIAVPAILSLMGIF